MGVHVHTLLAAAAMSAFALSNADLVMALPSILSTAACGGLRMRMSRFNSLKLPAEKISSVFILKTLNCMRRKQDETLTCGGAVHIIHNSSNPLRRRHSAYSSGRQRERWIERERGKTHDCCSADQKPARSRIGIPDSCLHTTQRERKPAGFFSTELGKLS